MLEGNPTTTMNSEDAMQAAVDLLWTTYDDSEQFALATARAQVLVSMARELRLGKAKTRKYGDMMRPQQAPPTVPAPLTLELMSSTEQFTEPQLASQSTEGTSPQNVETDPSTTGAP